MPTSLILITPSCQNKGSGGQVRARHISSCKVQFQSRNRNSGVLENRWTGRYTKCKGAIDANVCKFKTVSTFSLLNMLLRSQEMNRMWFLLEHNNTVLLLLTAIKSLLLYGNPINE